MNPKKVGSGPSNIQAQKPAGKAESKVAQGQGGAAKTKGTEITHTQSKDIKTREAEQSSIRKFLNDLLKDISKLLDEIASVWILAIDSDTTQRLTVLKTRLQNIVKNDAKNLDPELQKYDLSAELLVEYLELLSNSLDEVERKGEDSLEKNLGIEPYQKATHVSLIKSLLDKKTSTLLRSLNSYDKEQALKNLKNSLTILKKSAGVKEDAELMKKIDRIMT